MGRPGQGRVDTSSTDHGPDETDPEPSGTLHREGSRATNRSKGSRRRGRTKRRVVARECGPGTGGCSTADFPSRTCEMSGEVV
jgi:hypothetical protein